jgi:tetratricopeptide (TPR) repeat protein
MKTGGAFLTIILIILVLASLGAAAFFYLSVDEEKNKTARLESDLESAKLVLQGTQDKLIQQDKQTVLLNERSKTLTEELSSLKQNMSQQELAKSLLDTQIKELTAKKKMLEAQLTKVMQSAQEQITLKEKDVDKKIEVEKEKFTLEKEAFDKQLKSSEVLLQSALKSNELLRAQLEKNRLALEGLHRDKIGAQLLETKDELKEKQAKLEQFISENEKLIESFQGVEEEKQSIQEDKTELEDQLLQAQEELKRQTAKFYYNLGLVYDQSNRHRDAEKEYKKALKLLPDDPDIHYNLAVLYDENLRDNRMAIYHYKSYLRICPTAKDADTVEIWLKRAENRLSWGGMRLKPPKDYVE